MGHLYHGLHVYRLDNIYYPGLHLPMPSDCEGLDTTHAWGTSYSLFLALSYGGTDTTLKTCIHLKAAFIATGAINILTDSLILCLPMPFVWRLHTNLYRRISLMFIFSLGSFVVFASIYRFSTIFDFDPVDTSCEFLPSHRRGHPLNLGLQGPLQNLASGAWLNALLGSSPPAFLRSALSLAWFLANSAAPKKNPS
jgi:hypothetical protein